MATLSRHTAAGLLALAALLAASMPAQAQTGATISLVSLTSDSGTDDTYAIGDTVAATVTFSESVTVDTTNGTPQLELDIGGEARQADYASGSGSTALVFTYTVAVEDERAVGVAACPPSVQRVRNGG